MVIRRLLSRLTAARKPVAPEEPELDQAALQRLRFDLIRSELFDPDFYLEQNPDVRASGVDPATHFLRQGGIEGRDPSPRFDSEFYLDSYPDLRRAKVSPLVHYILYGKAEGRITRALPRLASRPVAPTPGAWQALAEPLDGRVGPTPIVDVVVPVFAGFHETANCLYTLVRSRIDSEVPCEIVAIDDRSPEPELTRLLDDLAARGLITLLRNESNLGFVATVNRGMALHGDRDVILLNSDTEVYADWVERLHRAAYSDPCVGSVTPFSNNATICSYPHLAKEFRGSFEVSFAEIDRLASEANAGLTSDIPTAIGFCMYIRRDCLNDAGAFDEQAFGRGYGEENDFCRRIAARGWRNILAADVFVRHLGKTSFGASTKERIQAALEIVKARYPRYLADVDDFLAKDPPKALRRRIDVARLRRANGERSVLFCVHGLDGGTLTHIRELSLLLAREGVGSLLLRPVVTDGHYAELRRFDIEHLSDSCRLDLRHGLRQAVALLRDAGVAHIHVHHLLGFSFDAAQFIDALARGLGIAYDVTVHDYLAICPRVNMIDGSGVYCANLDVEVCESCVGKHGSRVGDVSVWQWRAGQERFLAGARRVFVPHEDVKARLETFLPALDFTVRLHPEPVPENLRLPVERQRGEILRVAVIGGIGPPKGSLQLLRCAEDAERRRLPIQFVLVGFADRYELNTLVNVQVTGKYTEDDLPRLLARERCHLAFLPSVWPETYCYTLSQAFFAGLFPVAFDIGAIAARIRSAGWGLVLPWELVHDAARVNDALLAARPAPPPANWHPVEGERLYPSILADYYGLSKVLAANAPA